MTAKEWIGVMKRAKDFPRGLEELIVVYGKIFLEEELIKFKKFWNDKNYEVGLITQSDIDEYLKSR